MTTVIIGECSNARTKNLPEFVIVLVFDLCSTTFWSRLALLHVVEDIRSLVEGVD